MKRGKKLIKDTIIIAIGSFSTKVLSFFLLPFYTSLLTTSDYGVFDLIYTIACFLVPIITILIEESMFRFLIDCKTIEEKKKIITQAFLIIVFNSFFFFLIFLILSFFINVSYKYMLLLFILSQILVALRNTLCRGLGNLKLYSFSGVINSLFIIALNIILIVYCKMGVNGLLISYIFSNIIVSIFVLLYLKVYNYISKDLLDKKIIKEMLKYSIPLVPNGLSLTIINLSDRVVVSSFMGTAVNGIYSMAYKIPNLMDTIYGFFSIAWKENAARTIKDKDSSEYYNHLYKILKCFMWSTVLFLIATIPFIFDFLIKKSFKLSYSYIPILIIAMYFSNISGYYGGIFSAYKETKSMGKSTIYGAIINLIIDITLISFIGIWAAAFSTLIATFIVCVYRKYKIKKYITLHDNYKLIIFNTFIVLLVLLSYYFGSLLFKLFTLFVVIIYSIIINKEIINKIISKIKKQKQIMNQKR